MLQRVTSKIAVQHDTWTTKSMVFTFAGSIASWVDEDWKLVYTLLDFHPLADKEHAGAYAAYGFAKEASKLGILE